MDFEKYAIAVFVNLKRAFDTIEHKTLLQNLSIIEFKNVFQNGLSPISQIVKGSLDLMEWTIIISRK